MTYIARLTEPDLHARIDRIDTRLTNEGGTYDDDHGTSVAVIAARQSDVKSILSLLDILSVEDLIHFYKRTVEMRLLDPALAAGVLIVRQPTGRIQTRRIDALLINAAQLIHYPLPGELSTDDLLAVRLTHRSLSLHREKRRELLVDGALNGTQPCPAQSMSGESS